MDGLIVGFQSPIPYLKASFTGQGAGFFHSTFGVAGMPGAGSAPSTGLAGAALTSVTGQIPFPSGIQGQTTYLGGIDIASAGNVGSAFLVDRLWHNSGISMTTTTAQTITSATWPARDANGQTNGANVLVGLEVWTATGNASPITNTTLSYTNSAGSTGQTATLPSFPANAVVGSFHPFMLAAGDSGVRAISSITLGTSYVSGAMSLVAYRILAAISMPTSNTISKNDAVQLGMPVMYAQSVPYFLYLMSGTAGGVSSGAVLLAQG